MLKKLSFCVALQVFCTMVATSVVPIQAKSAGDGQQPATQIISPDYVTVSGDLPGLYAFARVVIVGQVLGSPKMGKHLLAPNIALPLAEHQVRIVEVLKQNETANLTAGEHVVVDQEAGVVEHQGRLIEIDRNKFDTLKSGATYVLFLGPRLENGHFNLAVGPHGVYLLSQGRAITQGKSVLVTDDANELLTQLRSLQKGPIR